MKNLPVFCHQLLSDHRSSKCGKFSLYYVLMALYGFKQGTVFDGKELSVKFKMSESDRFI